MKKQVINAVIFMSIVLFPILAFSETVDVLIKGIDDSVKTNKQQDYKEAVMNAKLQAIERAGVEIQAITRVVNFQIRFDMVESKAKAVLLPGFQIIDMGYQTDGTYQVVLSGKVKVGSAVKDPDVAVQEFNYAKSLHERGRQAEAEEKFKKLIEKYPNGNVAQESMLFMIRISLKQSELDEAIETYWQLKSKFPQNLSISNATDEIAQFILNYKLVYKNGLVNKSMGEVPYDRVRGCTDMGNYMRSECVERVKKLARNSFSIPQSWKDRLVNGAVEGIRRDAERHLRKLESIGKIASLRDNVDSLIRERMKYDFSVFINNFVGGWSAYYIYGIDADGYVSVLLREIVN